MKQVYLLICFLNISTACMAQSAIIDPEFGNAGYTTATWGCSQCSGNAVAVQHDGKIVAGGSWGTSHHTVARYNADGTVDSTFGVNGYIKSNYGIQNCFRVFIQSDGKIVLMGNRPFVASQPAQAGLLRYLPDGSIDSLYGLNGIAATNYMNYHALVRVATIQPDDKILVGSDYGGSNNEDFAISRFNTDGSLDTTFGQAGNTFVDFGTATNPTSDGITDLYVQSNGNILAVGNSSDVSTGAEHAILSQLNADGNLNSNFGTNGKLKWTIPGVFQLRLSKVQSTYDYKVLVLCTSQHSLLIVRFNANGTVDANYAQNGIRFWDPLGTATPTIVSFFPDFDHNFLFAGYKNAGVSTGDMYLGKLNKAGYPDSTFSSHGVFIVSPLPPSPIAQVSSAALQTDGKVLMLGSLRVSGEKYFFITRIITDLNVGTLDTDLSDNTLLVYPNPVHENSLLEYSLEHEQKVTVQLLDMGGMLVQSLMENEVQLPGKYSIPLSLSSQIPAGAYILSVRTENEVTNVKIVK